MPSGSRGSVDGEAEDRRQLELEIPGDRRREFVVSVDTAMYAARTQNPHAISNLSSPDAAEEVAARPVAAISSRPAPINMRYVIERSILLSKKGIAALATSP